MKSWLQKGESPDDWIEHLDSIRSRIEQISRLDCISDHNLMLHILSHLLEKYENIVDQAVKELTKKTLSLDTLQEDLQLKFKRLTLKKGKNKEHALSAKQVKGKCTNCGKQGRKKADCWELEANKSKRPKNWTLNNNKNTEVRNPKNPNM